MTPPRANAQPTAEWLNKLPKVELHVHLEGAIPHDTLWTLIQKYGGDETCPDRRSVNDRLVYRDFPHFIATWHWMTGYLREAEDFRVIASDVARDFARQNIRYVEAFYSPGDFAQHGLSTQQITEAICEGLAEVPEVTVRLVADLVRDRGPENATRALAEVNEVRQYGVIGIGIGGQEHLFPPEPFAEVYERARELGFRTSAHAGEAAGAESVWGAVRDLRVDRIGHGTRAIEDDSLVDYLAEKQIPVELNPISNVRTAVVPSLAEHPVRDYYDRGLLVCINTDDPKLFNTSLVEEYAALSSEFKFSCEDVRRFQLNAVEASWMTDEEKQEWRQRLAAILA